MPYRKIKPQLKYGVVKYRGTLKHGSSHELVFESDDTFQAMEQLEHLSNADEEHGYVLVIKDKHPQNSE